MRRIVYQVQQALKTPASNQQTFGDSLRNFKEASLSSVTLCLESMVAMSGLNDGLRRVNGSQRKDVLKAQASC